MKRFLALMLVLALSFSLIGCSSSESPAEETTETSGLGYKIGVVTGTVSQGEEEYRAAEAIKARYGNDIILQTYPDKFMDEQETTISNILSIANDPEVKAIVICQAVPGTAAAIDKVREIRDDILIVAGIPGEAPNVIAPKADIVFAPDELGMGTAVVEQAHAMGAETFVHYSFPRHMSYETLKIRRDMFEETCNKLGMTFVDATAPDPTGDAGVPGTQQFILEDIPRKVEEYGPNTNFFSTNCAMQEPLIRAALENGAIVAQQCCPSPYHGYPGALGIDVKGHEGDIDYAIQEISAKIAEKDGTGRFATWKVPVKMLFVDQGVEYAIAYLNGEITDKCDPAKAEELFEAYSGGDVSITPYTDENGVTYDNYLFVLADYITF